MQKNAGALLKYVLPGVANAAIFDSMFHGGGVPFTGDWNLGRAANTALNLGIGAQGGKYISKGDALKGIKTIALTPTKDLAISAVQATPKLLNWIDSSTAANKASEGISKDIGTTAKDILSASNTNKIIGGALGLGALGIGGAALYKYLKSRPADEGKIRLKLPGKKGDPSTEAEVEVPIGKIPMSPNLQEGLFRNVRLQARRNVRANSKRRDPETGKLLTMDEFEAKYGKANYTNAKAASTVLPAILGSAIGGGLASTYAKDKPYLAMSGGALGGAVLAALIDKLQDKDQKKETEQQKYNDDSDLDME